MKEIKTCVIVCTHDGIARYLFDQTLEICDKLIDTRCIKSGSVPYILLKDGRELYFVKNIDVTEFTRGRHIDFDISDIRYEICLECYEAERTTTKRIATEIITKFWDGLAGNVDEWIVDFIKSTAKEYNVEV